MLDYSSVGRTHAKRSDSTSTVDSAVPFSDPSFEFNAMKRQLFKTKICRHFLSGKCKYNSSCTFAHSREDLKLPPDFRKSRLCQKGTCTDPLCQYAHSPLEIRETYSEMCPHWLKGSCPYGTTCKLSHNLSHFEEMAIAASMQPAPEITTPTCENPMDLVDALLQLLSTPSSGIVSNEY